MRFNARKGVWVCLGCGQKGNIFQLAERLGVAVIDAGVQTGDLRKRIKRINHLAGHPNQNKELRMDERALKHFVPHPYWNDTRGLSQRTVEMFGLGYDPVTERAVIPIRNSYGNLLGVIYRRLDDGRPKYLYPVGFARGRSLYASWVVRQSARTSVAVVEGAVDALKCWDAHVPAVALLGSTLAEGQRKLLQSLGVHVVVAMLDNDSAGETGTAQLVHALRGSGIRAYVSSYGDVGSDPGSTPKDELREAFDRALTMRR
jgi:DNA primase